MLVRLCGTGAVDEGERELIGLSPVVLLLIGDVFVPHCSNDAQKSGTYHGLMPASHQRIVICHPAVYLPDMRLTDKQQASSYAQP
jgi:hypothetical protein